MNSIITRCTMALFAGVALSLSGCVATGPRFSETTTDVRPDKAIVHVYRPGVWGESARPIVTVDQKSYCDLLPGGYTTVYLAPGKHAFGLKFGWRDGGDSRWNKAEPTIVDCEGGRVQYLRLAQDNAVLYAVGAAAVRHELTLAPVPEERALSEIKACRYVLPLQQ